MRIHAAHRLLPAFTETMINAILSPSNFTVQITTSCFQISHSVDVRRSWVDELADRQITVRINVDNAGTETSPCSSRLVPDTL